MRIDGEHHHVMLLFSNSAVEKLSFSRPPKSTKQASKQVAVVSTEPTGLVFVLLGLVGASPC